MAFGKEAIMCLLAFGKICFIPEVLCFYFLLKIRDGMALLLVLDTMMCEGELTSPYFTLLSTGHAAGKRHENSCSPGLT